MEAIGDNNYGRQIQEIIDSFQGTKAYQNIQSVCTRNRVDNRFMQKLLMLQDQNERFNNWSFDDVRNALNSDESKEEVAEKIVDLLSKYDAGAKRKSRSRSAKRTKKTEEMPMKKTKKATNAKSKSRSKSKGKKKSMK